MLAVFGKSVVQAPEQLIAARSDKAVGIMDLVSSFKEDFPEAVLLQFDNSCIISYSHEKQALLKPRSFAVVDDMFCVFEGILENLTGLKQMYGLSKTVNEVMVVIEGYRNMRDRAAYPADNMLREWRGHYAFILFDKTTQKIFVGADSQGKVALFWGITSDGSLAFSDSLDILKKGCDHSCSSFPAGCFFSTDQGLQSYDHPLSKIAASPKGERKDNFGVKFEVQGAGGAQAEQALDNGRWPSGF